MFVPGNSLIVKKKRQSATVERPLELHSRRFLHEDSAGRHWTEDSHRATRTKSKGETWRRDSTNVKLSNRQIISQSTVRSKMCVPVYLYLNW